MPLSSAEWKAFIPVRVGDTTTINSTNLNTIWTMHDDKVPVELQFNYALIEAVNLLLGANWQDVTFSEDGQSIQDSDKFKHLLSLAQGAQSRITLLEAQRLGASGVSVGVLTTRAPITSPTGWPDANAVTYAGGHSQG